MSSAVESANPAAEQQNHTAAEEVKEAATEFEAKRDHSSPEPITTNPEEAHEKPALLSRNTAATSSTVDGADDNASMIPLGKAKADDAIDPVTPTTPSVNTDSGAMDRRRSIRMTPTRADIDSAKSAVIMAVAGCPVEREVSFSDVDNGTDTGRLEVRQILKGYKGIDEAIKEMNRDVKYKIVNDKPMSKDDAHKALGINQDGEGELSFANSGYKSGAQTPVGLSGTAVPEQATRESGNPLEAQQAATNLKPVELPSGKSSMEGSRDMLSDKEALAAGPSSGTDASKPPLARLNTLQREELAKVSTPGANTESTTSPLAAAGAGAAATTAAAPLARKASVSRKPVPAIENESKDAPASGHSRQNSAGTDSLATRLRAEIEERARATKEARSHGQSGATDVGPKPDSAVLDNARGPSSASAFSATSTGSRLPAFDWEKERDRSRAATPEPAIAPKAAAAETATTALTEQSKPTESSFRGPITGASAAAAVAALPELRRDETSGNSTRAAAGPSGTSSDKPHPVVMTDTTPELNPAVASAVAASPAGDSAVSQPAASESTETSKPSAFTEEFGNSAPTSPTAANGDVTQAEKGVPVVATALGGAGAGKEAPKLSYASQPPGNKRESKSGGFLSGLFRRKSRSGKPDTATAASAPRKSEDVARAEPTETLPTTGAATTEQPAETRPTTSAALLTSGPDKPTLSRVQTSGSNASAKQAAKQDTLPANIEEAAAASVAGDVPVIESAVDHAGSSDAEHPITEEGHRDASILENLEQGPDETIGEPSRPEDATSVQTREGSMAEPLDTGAIAVGTGYNEANETPAAAAPVAVSSASPTQKKKNRFSSFFSKFKSDSSPAQTYQRESTSATSPISPTREMATETDGRSPRSTHTAERSLTPEPEEEDNRSITAIAASVPLPEPVYTPEVQAKRDRIRKKREHQERVRLEKERQERELLAKRDRILNAYTGKQDFSKVPKPSRTKNFGRTIHTGSQKEGADPIQHIVKADKKAYKAEERGQSNSRGSSLHEEDGAIAAARPEYVDSSDDEATPAVAGEASIAESKPAAVEATLKAAEPTEAAPAASSGMEPVPTDSSKTAAVLGSQPATPASPPKKRKSVKSTKSGTATHKRKSSTDAGLAPLSPVKAEKPAAESALPTSTSDTALPVSPTKSTSSGKDGALKKRASTKSNKSHKREKSGDASVLSEDHTLHLTGETASTGLVKKPSTKSKTGRRKSVEPSTTVAGQTTDVVP